MSSPSPAERIRQLEQNLAAITHERDEYRKLYELVTLELERVQRHLRMQNKSERVDTSEVQLAFAAVLGMMNVPQELIDRVAAEENQRRSEQQTAATKPKQGHGRRPLPEHLPTERIELHPPELERACASCGTQMHPIGEESSERLDWRPASFVRVTTARIKYACACEDGGVTTAALPPCPIEHGLAGPGLLAHVIISKYEDSLPLHRLANGFAREGVKIAGSTLGGWVAQSSDLLRPIADAMAAESLGAHRIHTDDTGIPILAKGGVYRGHVWVYIADDDHVVFRYTTRRSSDGPRQFFRGYTGYVQADAANLYDWLFRTNERPDTGPAIEVACWSHARRKFVEAESSDRERAYVALGFIRELFLIDAEITARALPLAQSTAERRTLASPVLDAFKPWLDAQALVVVPGSPIAVAIGYVRNHWEALTRFLEDGRLRLDNNAAERALRRIAVGRKNWLFAGSELAAERACVLYSLLASCRLHAVNPFDYLRDVLTRVSDYPARRILELAPKAWKQQLQNLNAT